MKLVRISESETVNLEQVTRIETYRNQEVSYITLHFVGGASYRCTEEESAQLSSVISPMIEG